MRHLERCAIAVALAIAMACGSSNPTKAGGTTGGGTTGGCTPTTCAAQSKNCGTISDGCGGTLACGDCAPGRSCGAGGTANVCGTGAACTPTTCSAQGKNCGTISDSCSGLLQCGSCPAGQTCGGGGTSNVCGVASLQGGQTRWVRIVDGPGDDTALAVGGDDAGGAFTLADDTAAAASVLEKDDDSSGNALWSDKFGFQDTHGVIVSPAGNSYLARLDPIRVEKLIDEFAGDGSPVTTIDTCFGGGPAGIDECALDIVSADPMGDTIVRRGFGNIPDLIVRDAAGQVRWSIILGGDGATHWPIVLDRQSNVIVALSAYANGTFLGQSLTANHLYVAKTDLAGDLLWLRELAGLSGTVSSLGTSAAGTVVVAGTFSGRFTWGADTLQASNSGFLLTIEADGRPRWARDIGHGEIEAWQLAVDPEGRAALGGISLRGPPLGFPPICSPSVILYYDLAGNALWSRTLPFACDSFGYPLVATLANHDVLVGGMFTGTADLGNGPVTAVGRAAFFLDLAP